MYKFMLFVVGLGCLGLLFAPPSNAITTTEIYEQRIALQINEVRQAHDKARLRHGRCIDRVAERWVQAIATAGTLVHQEMTYIVDRCNAVYAGEILGKGSITPKRMTRLWMQSDKHRSVILNSQSRRIGVGAIRKEGNWWVVVDFLRK